MSSSLRSGIDRRSLRRTRLVARAQDVIRDAVPGRRLRLALAVSEVERRCPGEAVRILDAGSEEGLFARAAERRHPVWTVVSVDLSFPALQRGRDWARAVGRRALFVQADLTRPLGDAAFDVVVSLESLAEVPDDDAALTRMIDALRPGGWLVLQVPTHDWTPVLPGSERTWRREVRHGYRPDELAERLGRLGLTGVEIRPTFHRPAALAQDLRDATRHRSTRVRLLVAPILITIVSAERLGLRVGRPRAWFVVARKR